MFDHGVVRLGSFTLLGRLTVLCVAGSLFSSGCIAADMPKRRGGQGENRQARPESVFAHSFSKNVPADAGSPDAPLLFCVGIHIEPFGARNADDKAQNYNDAEFLRFHSGILREMAKAVEKHGGKMTVQAQTPFSSSCVANGEKILSDLRQNGHEIALHFHEDAHLGRQCEKLTPARWTEAMRDEIAWLNKAGAGDVAYWSGGNLYPHLLEAASAAGLRFMGDYKNPMRQESDIFLLAVNPWRPAAGPSQNELSAFAKHDPKGPIVYLPDGIFKTADFKDRKEGGLAAFFDALTEGLELSLRAAKRDRVNVFHITLHPGELRGAVGAKLFDDWLGKVIVPLVSAGKVKWATFSEMGNKYLEWEKANPGVDPRGGISVTGAEAQARSVRAYMTFAVNIHDWVHWNESADTVIRLAELFGKYGVKGDFYFTAPIAETYAQKRPDVIKVINATGMTVSYHVRPPNPIYLGFHGELAKLDDASLKKAILDLETFRLDLQTGGLDRSKPGGYTYVARLFGRKPVVVSPQAGDKRIRRFCEEIYREMGAQMALAYHEEGTALDSPLEYTSGGLMIRPSDFSITRWSVGDEGKESFWWNKINGRAADKFNPVARLKEQLALWKHPRPPFVTALIHENNFYHFGPEAWKAYYFSDIDARMPAKPPYDLSRPDPGRMRPKEEQEKIWKAYDELVAYAAANLAVVTSEDIVKMGNAQARQ